MERKMKRQLYQEANKGSEYVYDLEHFKDILNDSDEEEIVLDVMQREINGDAMWCKKEGEFVVRGEDNCGKRNCNKYEPCNGKSGKCRHLTWCYIPSGKQVIIKRNKEGIK
jgi:hypothetical protein